MAVDDPSFSRDQQQEENNVTLEAHSSSAKHIFSTGNDELRLFSGVCFHFKKDSLVLWPRMLINL
jgi:hypothetical protein